MSRVSTFNNEIKPAVRNSFAAMKLLGLGKPATIEFYNGMKLRFDSSEQELFINIAKSLMKLRRTGIEPAFADGILTLRIFPNSAVRLAVNNSTKMELYNLISLVYYSLKYGAVINSEKGSLADTFRVPSLYIDSEKRTVETNNRIKFGLKDIEPWIFVETFVLSIHNRLMDNMKNKTVLDIGACFGDTALYFASRGARVFSLEPAKRNFQALNDNLDLNPRLKKLVHPMQCALGKSDGIVEMRTSGVLIDGGSSAFMARVGASEKVKSYRFDTLVKDLKLEYVDYVKMDCKGAEFFLTSHDLGLIKKYIQIEYTAENEEQTAKLLGLLERSGFKTLVYRQNPGEDEKISERGTICGVR